MSNNVVDISLWEGRILQAVPIGKRIKRTVYDPKGNLEFYFKEPENKYPWEFWTEIVASRVGKELGFNTLKYVPAIFGDRAGCLSPSMVNEAQDLIHGQQYLIQIMRDFDKKKGSDHSFQIVEHLFKSNEHLQPLLKEFIYMLVFDAIIGNHDRHQQNWAIIRTLNLKFKKDHRIELESLAQKITRKFMKWLDKKGGLKGPVFEKVLDIDSIIETFSFSQLFDNGNSLAYNILEQNIPDYLNQKSKLESYLFGKKANSHIKWGTDEIGYIPLLENIKPYYNEALMESVEMIQNKFSENAIERIIYEVNKDFPESHSKYSLTLQRKELMYKIIVNRKEELLRRLL